MARSTLAVRHLTRFYFEGGLHLISLGALDIEVLAQLSPEKISASRGGDKPNKNSNLVRSYGSRGFAPG
jgi:hypothetical protein